MRKRFSACTCLLNFTESLQCCNERPQRVSPNSRGASGTHTSRMQRISLPVWIRTNIYIYILHRVTVARNGIVILDRELSDNFWEHHSASSAFAAVNACKKKNSRSMSIIRVDDIWFHSNQTSFTIQPECQSFSTTHEAQAKPRRVAAKNKYPRAYWQPGKWKIEAWVWQDTSNNQLIPTV